MPTGACGINCDVCKLRLMGTCSSCGPGRSPEAERKLEAQRRLIGDTCSILECAVFKRVDYCLHYLYWSKNDEFGTRIEVLFDRSIEKCLTPSGIWGLIWRVNMELIRV